MHSFLGAVEDFYKIEGEQVHEVAVGPVHAESSNQGISVFSVMVKRYFIWKLHLDTSIVA
jgi:hypothetical protein